MTDTAGLIESMEVTYKTSAGYVKRVPSHFARELERELAARTTDVERMQAQLSEQRLLNDAAIQATVDVMNRQSAQLAACQQDAERYRLYKVLIYDENDTSFDAYDPEGMDAELDSRIAARRESRKEGK